MVQLGPDNSTQCAVYDKTPGSEQKKINIVVRPAYTVSKVISAITTQYPYEAFDIVLQPTGKEDLVYLNDRQTSLLYEVPGFQADLKNTLILLPPGEWDGNVKQRYDLALTPLKSAKKSAKKSASKVDSAKKNLKILTNTTTTVTTTTTKKTRNNNSSSKLDITSINTNNNNNNNNTTASNSSLSNNSNINSENQSDSQSQSQSAAASNDVLVTMATVSNRDSHNSATNSLNLSPMSDPDHLSDDDLALGASASPTETEPQNGGPLTLAHTSSRGKFGAADGDPFEQIDKVVSSYEPPPADKKYPLSVLPSAASTNAASGYVGLVNQAMTCYLNSLLQALYMTPEFRNALYRWEFDNDTEAKNIPYQLQKLFLNLQTSKKSAVETTDLTRSFGWDSTEAWQQHDIQELCRILFDALEHKFKNTKQANLISTLYEGKMIDYVKCLECNTEKTRSDTFLDIPLPVRPFGSTVAYGSIEEALRAFVQPETLDGNNQYFCEKCNKKCDAHKGLKFKEFPYVLTLHLKRFDFDYQTMHRIKLNDKVTFPQTLNLNTFVNATDAQTFANLQASGNISAAAATVAANSAAATTANGYILNGVVGTTDDYSTTDSGSAMEEDNCSSGIATTASSSQHENDMNDDDEGIDMSSSTDHRHSNSGATAEQRLNHESGPYLYELFAIMIHSGSASGGHYYAYIREFENSEWFCFNDQTVSAITQEDIQRSFGGSSSKAYYSSVYSSSTNAYMLMYRQIDPKRNERIMQLPDFPAHISNLLPQLNAEEETRVSRPTRHSTVADLALPELVKPYVYFYNPQLKKLKVTRVYVSQSFDVRSVLESAYQILNVEKFAPLSHCRLVAYDQITEEILQSLEDETDYSLTEVRAFYDSVDFLLEYRGDGQEFQKYKPGGTTWYVYTVNLPTMGVDGPFFVHSSTHECDDVLRHSIAARLYTKDSVAEKDLVVATLPNKKAFVAYDPAAGKDSQSQLRALAKAHFSSLTYFYMNVPCTEPNSLEILGIPAYETPAQAPAPAIEVSADVVDAVLMNGGPAIHNASSSGDCASTASNISCPNSHDSLRRESPLPPSNNSSSSTVHGHESNSEDSSLSDGDRTLVESIQHRGGGDSQVSSTSSRSPQLSSPENESHNPYYINRIYDGFLNQGSSQQQTDSEHAAGHSSVPQFFQAVKLEAPDISNQHQQQRRAGDSSVLDDAAKRPKTKYKILVNSHMKMCMFKRHIEAVIRVPSTHFKIQRKHDLSDAINPVDSVLFLTEGETLQIELGKELSKEELKANISFMRLSDMNNDTGKLPYICEWVYNASMTVAEAKKELVAKLHRIDAKYQTLTVENCRIWLSCGRNPIKIFGDEETLFTRRATATADFIVQECEDGVNPQPHPDSFVIFVRRWHADKLQLDNFQEITLDKDSEIRNVLAKITDLKEEHIAYTKVSSSFPCTNISLLSINGSMSWFSIPATMDIYPLTTTLNGNIYFYKDVRPAPKELSTQERRELNTKEKSRLDRLGCLSVSLASPRRERALKIYLDSPTASPNTTPTTTPAAAPMDATSGKAADE